MGGTAADERSPGTASNAGAEVAVTGASGYLGSHVVRELLERGYAVRATVRDLSDPRSTEHLRKIAADAGASARLELFEVDVTRPGALDAVVDGCRYLCHMAAVVRLAAKNPQRDIVDPAVDGTRSVLASAARAGALVRVVMTSSIAAVTDDEKPHGHVYTEADWNESADVRRSPYPLAKTLSERAAWALAREAGLDLVTLNPVVVLGPVYASGHRRSSPALLRDLMAGVFPAIPDFRFSAVDVRDVASAHVNALEIRGASGRYILSNRTMPWTEMCELARGAFPAAKIPKRSAPAPFWYLVALFDKRLTWRFLRRNLGRSLEIDGSRATRELGVAYRPLRETILETAQSLYAVGALR